MKNLLGSVSQSVRPQKEGEIPVRSGFHRQVLNSNSLSIKQHHEE